MTAKERPILFSAAMVRAILDGHKTQTRRVAKVETCDTRPLGDGRVFITPKGFYVPRTPDEHVSYCPYGQPGDRLWVRESWRLTGSFANEKPSDYNYPDILKDNVAYRADPYSEGVDDAWRPSIHLPRGLSRILLEITSVRVERVQEISNEDAIAEGINRPIDARYPVDEFRALWDSINAARGLGWDKNPWVWVVEFRKIS